MGRISLLVRWVLAAGAPGCALAEPGRCNSVAESRSERFEPDEALEEVESGEPGMMGMSGLAKALELLLGADATRVSGVSSRPRPCCSSTVCGAVRGYLHWWKRT